MLSFSGLFLGFGFALGPFLQQLIYAIVMIFFVKPYDVGDKISIGSEQEVYTVQSIGVWVTDMLDGSGKRHYWHNGNLAKEHIVNHTRTSRVELSIALGLSMNTPDDVLALIKEVLEEWVRSDPELYSQNPEVSINGIDTQKNLATVGISCQLNCSWMDTRRGKAKGEFIKLIHKLVRELGLTYTPPSKVVLTHKADQENKKEK